MRVGAIGMTRFGKTFLMEKLAAQQPRVIVVDTKHQVEWSGYYLTESADAALVGKAIQKGNAYRVIYRVPDGAAIPEDFWMRAVRLLHELGGGIIYIDEMPMITGPNTMPRGLRDAFRVGGGLGVGVWWSSQEAVGVHNTPLRQSEILFLFYNQGSSDRDKLILICGDIAEATKDLPKFDFIIYKQGEAIRGDAPTYRAAA